MRATLVAAANEPIALDSKSIHGATTGEQKVPHMLSFCTHHSQEILLQVRVDKKTNEIPIALQVLPCLLVAGRVHAWQGDAVLTVKANQPTLYDDLEAYFADPEACFDQALQLCEKASRYEMLILINEQVRLST